MYVPHQRQHHSIAPPLSMDAPSSIDRAVGSYSTPSSATVLPTLPQSPSDPAANCAIEAGRIFRLASVRTHAVAMAKMYVAVWTSFNSRSVLECVALVTRYVAVNRSSSNKTAKTKRQTAGSTADHTTPVHSTGGSRCSHVERNRHQVSAFSSCTRLVWDERWTRLVERATADGSNVHSEIDTSFYVLTVDLWSGDGTREVNLVRHSATSPSISAATSSSYPPPSSAPSFHTAYPNAQPQQVQLAPGYPQPLPQLTMHQQMANHNAYQQGNMSMYPPNYNQHAYQQALPPPPLASQPQQGYYNTTPTGTPLTPTYYSAQMPQSQGPLLSPHNMPPVTIDPRSSPSGMFTRNLIGSLCVSAFKLTDPENNMGVWFILQDLSVRTEGSFRYIIPVPIHIPQNVPN